MAPPLRISSAVRTKLQTKHNVSEREIEQCFDNRSGNFLFDDREDNRTDPATHWFIAETNRGRELKICFMHIDGNVHIKTAYPPNAVEIQIYKDHAF